jgi:hypothetical protein
VDIGTSKRLILPLLAALKRQHTYELISKWPMNRSSRAWQETLLKEPRRGSREKVMSSDKDIEQFVASIGAKEPSPDSTNYGEWRIIFKRSNYFIFNGRFMIVKVSRSEKPFWGVGKEFIDLFNSLDDYYLVLLISSMNGWVFTKSDVNANINNNRWKLRQADNNYKINYPLPDRNSFFSPKSFLNKLRLIGGI